MNKFKNTLQIIEEALLKPMSDERVKELDIEKVKMIIDKIKKRATLTLNEDGTYDVEGNVDLSGELLTKLPMKFGKVSGFFNCSYNKLRELNGAPKIVSGNFYCNVNPLITLEGAPKEVGGSFDCRTTTVRFTGDDVRSVCNVGGWIFCND